MDLKKRWEETFENSVKKSMDEIRCKYTNALGLEVEELPYEFTGDESEWMGAYLRRKNLLKDGKVVFALNREKIYEKMKKLLLHRNMKNTAMQARILVFHEVGHGLLDYLKSAGIQLQGDEEKIVTEFGRHSCQRNTMEFESVLEKAVLELIEMKSTENN